MGQDILASRPMCASACPYMFTFLMRFYQAELFARAEERVKRSLHTGQLGSDFYAALSGNCKDQSQQHIVFRYAVFSQAYASEKKVIAAADVKRMLAVAGTDAKDAAAGSRGWPARARP